MEPLRNKKVTVSAIAEAANVSPATVSRVLNHPDLVKETTIRQVEAAIDTLGYQMKTGAILSKATQPLIVMNIPGIENNFYQEIIRGARMSANAHGCHLLIHESPLNRGTILEFCNLLRRVEASGVILLNTLPVDSLEQIHSIAPIVQCCEFNENANLPYVSIDDAKAAEEATDYLIACGRNKLAMINGPSNFKYARERKKGFLNSLEKAEISIPKNWLVELPEVSYELAYAAICRLLTAEIKPNAFFAISDSFAAAVIRAAKRFHLKVPEDIIVVGFDNIETAEMTTPALTTVNQPKFQLGYTACEMLLELLENPQGEIKTLLLDTELVIREST